MPMDIASIIDGLELFQDFSYADLKTLGRYLKPLDKAKGEVVFAEGDPGDYMLILAEGKLSVFKGGEHGAQLLSHEGRGRIVGEMAPLAVKSQQGFSTRTGRLPSRRLLHLRRSRRSSQ